jgi:hypothetical protein
MFSTPLLFHFSFNLNRLAFHILQSHGICLSIRKFNQDRFSFHFKHNHFSHFFLIHNRFLNAPLCLLAAALVILITTSLLFRIFIQSLSLHFSLPKLLFFYLVLNLLLLLKFFFPVNPFKTQQFYPDLLQITQQLILLLLTFSQQL